MLIMNMLTDQHIKTETIKNDYKKLNLAWESELSRNSIPDMKRSNINKPEHMVHVFNNYLNQIWVDSQDMFKYEENPKNENAKECNSIDTVFCTNIVALHLMRQSLQIRQEFFKIVDSCNVFLGDSNTESLEWISSASTVSQDLNDLKESQNNEQSFIDFKKPNGHNSTTNDQPDTLENCVRLNSHADTQKKKEFVDSISSSIDLEKPIRLTSSPSTPIIGSGRTSQFLCSQNFSPACNYSTYFPRVDDNDVDHKISCHFCQETLPLKKSFSVQDMNSFRLNYTTNDDNEKEYHDDSSFEIASFYYNSENEDEVIEREKLLEKYHDSSLSEKYQIPNDIEGSLKIEIEQDNKSSSSSLIHYDCKTKQLKKNKTKRCRKSVYKYGEITLECESSYSSKGTGKSDLGSSTTSKERKSLNDSTLTTQVVSLSNKLRRSKVGTFISKNSAKTKQDTKTVGSTQSKNVNLCRIFSSRKTNPTSPIH